MGKVNSKSSAKKRGRQSVFKPKSGEVFRIPAIYYDEDEKLLYAFAEKRTSRDDSDAVALVVSTGSITFKTEVKWSNPKEVVRKCTCGYRPMNPCVLYEKHTQTLFLFFIYVNETEPWQKEHKENRARLCYITKKKNDDKWSDLIEVTELLPVYLNWSTFAVGPGHGIQTKSGRMIVPAYAYSKDKEPVPHAFYFYSDDYGSTWKCEKLLSEISSECIMTEILDSNKRDSLIYCNARSLGAHRVQATFDESGGHTLTTATPLPELKKGCQGSVICFPGHSVATSICEEKWLLFSHPTNQKSDWERLDLGVYLNTSEMRSIRAFDVVWSEPWIINNGPSGYSDMTYIEGGWFACLFECGENFVNEIDCQVFCYEEILEGIPD